ncbi:bile acid:sodium symporter family protein [Pseudoalteromonas sp. SMS1]|uniref:bile acid:sodium symporter family protein n=1 Tax=Pseudoalteromonas sp. SMS1 TaxID=2908894 RepID=UPI001F2F7455|nr:bile acid:sodium symporter family protein [Pseudoalteromonas sp. SMS1]MCF2856716.1 bile acid:sodium symporter family protein [Pseudoalteromonas sp. SMS1]
MLNRIIQLFPLWALLISAIAFISPERFTQFKSAIIPLLSLIMLSMGLTLTLADFSRVGKSLKAVVLGVSLQFLVMPLVAMLLIYLLQLGTTLSIGMILVGCVAGGTASNVMCFLAKGDVALSISMTAISTLIGVILTPLLISVYVGQLVDIPMLAMMLDLIKIVLAPVLLGLALNMRFKSTIKTIQPVLPLISMLAIIFIIAVIVALNKSQIMNLGPLILAAVMLHNGAGLLSGYWVARWCGLQERVCRTIAFEVGMQNSGLAVALAMKFFAPYSAALVGTVFSIWHNISGSMLASFWCRRSISDDTTETQVNSVQLRR